ncbi:AcvB/VirJ family lysyl-phosphatidylglycerol hydrolase [Pandoraea sp. CB10b_02]|uniref:virulence factor family protein n=1 Tax=Pandoraea sp. CB10b_02 TaxID=2014535 RepID=UPI00257F3153|nr:AcvB/VirJ family lysyl-phosphatidylglycerol hydrolase [Pandoraea sp. CB10b_02]
MKLRYWFPVAAGLLAVGLSLMPAARKIDGGRFGKLRIASVDGPVAGVTLLFSSAEGWTERNRDIARELADRGILTVGIDSRRYLANLSKEKADCQYLPADAEFVSQQLQRDLSTPIYHTPVVAGFGIGGRIAQVIRDQAAANTVKGAVVSSTDAEPQLPVALCDAPAPGVNLEGPEFVDRLPPDDTRAFVDTIRRRASEQPDEATQPNFSTLPLIELPASGASGRLAVVMSGDGGWRDLDKEISEHLRSDGVSVVGWDSLRYFWTEKTPDQTAGALKQVLDHYANMWHTPKITLIGYSFGANVLPFAYNRLPDRLKAKVDQLVLLAPEPSADFQIRVSGWLGLHQETLAKNVREQIATLPTKNVQCFYGAEESQSLCPSLLDTLAEVVRTDGGHHFDGNYRAIEQKILSFHRRSPAGRRH